MSKKKLKKIKIVKEMVIFDNHLTEWGVCTYNTLWTNYENEFPFKNHPICTKIKKEMYRNEKSYSDLIEDITEVMRTENPDKEIESFGEESLRNVIHKNNVDSKYSYYMIKALGLDKTELCMHDYFAEYLFEQKIKELGLSNKNNLSKEERELFVSIHDSIINDRDSLEEFMRKGGYDFELERDEDDDEITRLPYCIEQELIEIFLNDRDYLDQMLNGYRMRKEAMK